MRRLSTTVIPEQHSKDFGTLEILTSPGLMPTDACIFTKSFLIVDFFSINNCEALHKQN